MEEKIQFIYDKITRRPKRLENNVFILYAPERILLQPGEVKEINMKLKNFKKYYWNLHTFTDIFKSRIEIVKLEHDCTK